MKEHFWNKRIPTFLGLVLIIVGLVATTILVRQGGLFSINASLSTEPQGVRISNVTESSFTVSYQTSDQAFGVLSYGDTTALGKSGLDDRDQESGSIANHKIHNITIRNLDPETKYYFSIISGKETYLNNSVPYEVTTGSEISDSPPDQEPVSGSIILPTGGAPKESVIYLTTDNSQVISTLVKDDGTFILPLNSLRTSDFTSYFTFDESITLKLLAVGDGLTSNAILSLNQSQPIPTITLSNDYDFTSTAEITKAPANAQSFPAIESGQQTKSDDQKPNILTPTRDQHFSDQKPQFSGTAPANQTVQIIIHSDEKIETTIKTDGNGIWKFRPPNDLSVGTHTITLIAKDSKGVTQTLTQSFIVYASGSQLAGEAGSPTPTIVQSSSPTTAPTKSVSPTTIPTNIPDTTTSVTTTPTTDITSTMTPTLTESSISPTPPLPPTGNSTIIVLGIIGLVITFMGSFIFLLSRKSLI